MCCLWCLSFLRIFLHLVCGWLVYNTFINDLLTARCNIFDGIWVPDSNAPFYTNKTCHSIEEHQNCMENGRPDSDYVYWRWTPRDCALPRFNPEKFLRMMRNKSMAFIGDSISRNHVQSLLCTLSQVYLRFFCRNSVDIFARFFWIYDKI